MATAKPANRKVTAENLVRLGPERLAEILAEVAGTRADLKRRLRMELAAEQGADPLIAEIDRRLSSFETSRGQVTWRNKPAFLRDLDSLRDLIATRLAPLDRGAALERLWRFMAAARKIGGRLRNREDIDPVFARVAAEIGPLAGADYAGLLIEALEANPSGWTAWLPSLLERAPDGLAQAALTALQAKSGAAPGRLTLIRQLADAAGDPDAYAQTWGKDALATQPVAAEIGRRYLAAGRIAEAGAALEAAAHKPKAFGKPRAPDTDWESAWIDWLDAAGQPEAAQAARWGAFERTLSVDRARAYVKRLGDFDDVEAEQRAFAHAAAFDDFETGLGFLMAWPALSDAARMIERREDLGIDAETAELWAGKLRKRFPAAAHKLLRAAAATAFKCRQLAAATRLSQEADTIEL